MCMVGGCMYFQRYNVKDRNVSKRGNVNVISSLHISKEIRDKVSEVVKSGELKAEERPHSGKVPLSIESGALLTAEELAKKVFT